MSRPIPFVLAAAASLIATLLILSIRPAPTLANGDPLVAHPLQEPAGERPFAAPSICIDCPDECPDDELGVASIHGFSGEYTTSTVDLRVPGVGIDFVWARRYRSRLALPNSAQGNGWDFSYNVFMQQAGPNDVVIQDGNGRADLYCRQPDGVTFARDELFREGQFELDGRFTLTFPDTGTWTFKPLDGNPAEGKLEAITDRNGNQMTLDYDPNGNLVQIVDTLGRPFQIQYNNEGLIGSVVDFTGRSVTYEYYEDGDAGGSSRDLRSVTTPPVVDTPEFPIPPGHEFPTGKTTIYTYSKGFADEQLNHNLLTITDPLGQTYLQNTYAPTINPGDFLFDRLVTQVYGNAGDRIDFSYLQLTPDPGNQFSVVRVIENDRMGNVCEMFYDARNRCVIESHFTGQANPDLPTTDVVNRPGAPLRAGDPASFDTIRAYNEDSLCVQEIDPNGNILDRIYEIDLDPLAPRRSRGNLRQLVETPGGLGGDQPSHVELFEYDDDMGGCCGTNFVTRHVDARGNETVHEYDAAGNRTRTTHRLPSIVEDFEYDAAGRLTKHTHAADGGGARRIDTFTYYGPGDGHQNGYLQSEIIDQPGLALTTTYEYDLVGNVIRTIDPRNRDAIYLVNQLNQVIHEISRETSTGSGIRYDVVTFYDANDNIVRIETANLDENGVLQPNASYTTIFEYEILDRLVRTTQEVEDPQAIITEYDYDANRNLTVERKGEATNGNDPANVVVHLYDERDLLFRTTRGAGGATPATDQFDYDGNENLVTTIHGLEGTPKTTIFTYDGYDRRTSTLDAMGNEKVFTYDANDNVVEETVLGELLDIPGSAGNVPMFTTTYAYDAMDRLTVSEQLHFDPATQTPIGDGANTTTRTYEVIDLLDTVTLDDGRLITVDYDSALRIATIVDGAGNTKDYDYDANDNVLSVTETDTSTLGSPDEVFVTTYTYDGLDRLVRTTDSIGNETDYLYDSRGNRVVEIDSQRPGAGDPGNVTRHTYDGLDRLIETERFLTDDGTGTGTIIGSIVTTNGYDDSSRLIFQTDDNDNTTSYTYDALDRKTSTVYGDGTSCTRTYDERDNVVEETDARGTTVILTYDDNDRYGGCVVFPGAGVSDDTTSETFEYDGLSRVVRAEDDDSTVTRSYDSLYRIDETQNGTSIVWTPDALGHDITCIYPSGRTLTTTYDALDRKTSILDGGGTIATWDYIGATRVERLELGNDVRVDYDYDARRRMTDLTHTHDPGGANTLIDDRDLAWDQMSNKTSRADVRAGGPQTIQDFVYDSVERLIRSTEQSGALPADVTTYELDGVNNRVRVTGDGPEAGSWIQDATSPNPADAAVNQYTLTPFDRRWYDANGNLRAAGVVDEDGRRGSRYTYDYMNRLVRIDRTTTSPNGSSGSLGGQSSAVLTTTYAYDVLGRRIEKTLDAAGSPQTTRFYYDGHQVIEERDGNGATTATYVYGTGIDEVLTMQRGGNDVYYLRDDLQTVTGIVDAAGTVLERYEYDDYGDPRVRTPSGLSNGSTTGNPYFFTGRRFDEESGLYYQRNRYYEPATGTFLTRDPIGVFGDSNNFGNARAYVGANPWTRTDPMGLDSTDGGVSGALEAGSVEAAKAALKELVKKGVLPPGFDAYAEVLYKAAKAAVKAADGISLRRLIKMDRQGGQGNGNRSSGIVRRGGEIYRYIILKKRGPGGWCEVHVQKLTRVCLERGWLGGCKRWGWRWKPYKVYDIKCCNLGVRR